MAFQKCSSSSSTRLNGTSHPRDAEPSHPPESKQTPIPERASTTVNLFSATHLLHQLPSGNSTSPAGSVLVRAYVLVLPVCLGSAWAVPCGAVRCVCRGVCMGWGSILLTTNRFRCEQRVEEKQQQDDPGLLRRERLSTLHSRRLSPFLRLGRCPRCRTVLTAPENLVAGRIIPYEALALVNERAERAVRGQ